MASFTPRAPRTPRTPRNTKNEDSCGASWRPGRSDFSPWVSGRQWFALYIRAGRHPLDGGAGFAIKYNPLISPGHRLPPRQSYGIDPKISRRPHLVSGGVSRVTGYVSSVPPQIRRMPAGKKTVAVTLWRRNLLPSYFILFGLRLLRSQSL